MEGLGYRMALHFLIATLEGDIKTINKISITISEMTPENTYLFVKTLGHANVGMFKGIKKKLPLNIEKIKKGLSTDDMEDLT